MSSVPSDINLSPGVALYLLHHIFLPPKLPQEDDYNPEYELILLDEVIQALRGLCTIIPGQESDVFASVSEIIARLRNVCDTNGDVGTQALKKSLEELDGDGTVLPIYIRRQNAGVLLTKMQGAIEVQAFELSPRNQAVYTTPGRLHRQFPGPTFALDSATFQAPGFQETVAQTLAKMSHQDVAGTKAKVQKALHQHDEDRDTIDPIMITEFFTAFLRPRCEVIHGPQINKNTREEVLWLKSRSPWRRSALWLLVRATIQLVLLKISIREGRSEDLFKQFMIYFLSTILRKYSKTMSHEQCHIMSAKIGRRLRKLDTSYSPSWLPFVQTVLHDTHAAQQEAWDQIIRNSHSEDRQCFRDLDFGKDSGFSFPQLDQWLEGIKKRKHCRVETHVQPQLQLQKFEVMELPLNLDFNDPDSRYYNLAAFEAWVELNLDNWIQQHLDDQHACQNIGKLIETYHGAVTRLCSNNPEAISMMILTVLELWIACDRSAVHIYPALSDYDPCIPIQLWESLLLPRHSQMERLTKAEEYMRLRNLRVRHPGCGIFRDFGTLQSFSVRYFDQSSEHQHLLASIEKRASDDRKMKKLELAQKQQQYRDLYSLYSRADCTYNEVVVDREFDIRETRHSKSCQKCKYKNQADSIRIHVHEWPLPSRDLEAKSTIFELRPPRPFAFWRDTSIFVLSDVLKAKYRVERNPRAEYHLEKYSGLSSLSSHIHCQRTGLLSEDKPHSGTHRKNKHVINVAEKDVCLANGMHFKYFDKKRGSFISDFETTHDIPTACMCNLPRLGRSLQRFLFRPAEQSNGPPPNTVIASQDICPDGMSLGEYKALCSMGLGINIQWQNILRQLAAPAVVFKKVETCIFVLQIIHQAGPPVQGSILRAGHVILDDIVFAHALLVEIRKSADVIKENWECAIELNILVFLTLRVLSLSGSAEVQNLCLGHLGYLRGIAFEWVQVVGQRASRADADKHRNELFGRSTYFALICIATFDSEGTHLEQMLEPEMDASIFIQCCMVIHDKQQLLHGMSDFLVSTLYYRWQMLTYRCQRILTDSIVRQKRLVLDQAIQGNWAAYRTGSLWSIARGENQSWLVSQLNLDTATDSGMSLHYNILTGSLLINGLPLARLPSEFERHPSYRTLFEQSLVEVMPSNLPGMQFSGQREHFGHTIHLAKGPLLGSDVFDLNVRALKDGRILEFVPPRLLGDYKLPDTFVEDYAHWYDLSGGFVEFRPKKAPWRPSGHLWRLQRIEHGGGWCLVEGDLSLVNLETRTAKTLGRVLQPIEKLSKLHLRLNRQSSLLEIEAPRLRLSFTLQSGHSLIQSRQYPGMAIDANQSLGTLVGLRNRLLLVNLNNYERKVLIPEGNVVWEKDGSHLTIDIVWQAVANRHVYSVNTQLGCLIDNGSLQSKLFLCYLHAVTSFCAPDPLTQRTGTEQALIILHSASLRSFRQLQPEDTAILLKLAALTPVRRYYPANERVMQSVHWEKSLSCLAQHEDFRQQVIAIFSQNQRQNLFYPESQWKQPTLPAVDQDLLRRSRIRSATFRVSNFGSEDHTTAYDCAYVDLSRDYESDRSSAVFTLCKIIYDQLPPTLTTTQDMLRKHLWKFLSTHGEVNGPNTPIERPIGYDASWLLESGRFISRHWCSIHQLLSTAGNIPNKYQLMIWLSTLAFSKKIQEAVLEVLAAIYVAPSMFSEMPPPYSFFQLSAGHEANKKALNSHVQTHMRTVTPESSISAGAGETPRHFRSRIKQLRKARRAQALAHFISGLCSQWPVQNPSTPTSTHSSQFNDYYEEGAAMVEIRNLFLDWYKNWELERYVSQVASVFAGLPVQSLTIPSCSMPMPAERSASKPGYVDIDDILDGSLGPPPDLMESPRLSDFLRNTPETRVSTSALSALINTLDSQAKSPYESKYLEQLRDSLVSLKGLKQPGYISLNDNELERVLSEHLLCCEKHYETVYDSIISRMTFSDLSSDISDPKARSCRAVLQILASVKLWPRFSPDLLLRQLTRKRWPRLSEGWKRCLITYGLSITALQRAKRLTALIHHQPEDLVREIQNRGHTNWDPYDFPESLLLEIENNLLIREVQEQIAAQMRNTRAGENVVMQLNMGEGKSSVIVPIVVVAHAGGSYLVRVIVAKPQSRQMFEMLVAKLGGLLGRRVYHLPISRSVRVSEAEALEIEHTCVECMKEGGVLLVQPEHTLSLKLMCLEYFNIGEEKVGCCLLRTLRFLKTSSCDIVDESDENFSVRFELIYTMGTQGSLEFSPQRWVLIQQLLNLVRRYAPVVKRRLPQSIEIIEHQPGSFPRIRLLDPNAGRELLKLIAEEICTNGIDMLPISRHPRAIREAILTYVLSSNLSAQEIQAVEGTTGFWSPTTQDALLLLRGLIAGNVIAFCFGHKRWRVNYGSDNSRRPPTRLSVPFRAKDSPAPRAEFSHPDVVIMLTLLNYYNAGLSNEDLFLAFSHLGDSDQADSEYQTWVDDAQNLPPAYNQLSGVNLHDQHHCVEHVFPAFRFSKGAIDYFLAHIVFPKELKEFPFKLSASGWDIGEIKEHPTVGFSGTNDSRVTLPLSINQLDLPDQNHTNALVLNFLLAPENSVAYYPVRDISSLSDAQILLDMVVGLDPPVKVILDVGAQILELNNLEVARTWLRMTPMSIQNQAVVFVNEGDEICVVDRTGLVEPLQVSAFANHLESCFVFLDEAHTRGIDLRLPRNYRAAVTLGAGITKDKLVQACMRMRKLGHGQSVVFCIPEEIKKRLLALPGLAGSCDIDVSSVLRWAISETWADVQRSISLWAVQGERFERHSKLWQNLRHSDQASLSKCEAEGFLESESQSLKQRYRPQNKHTSVPTPGPDEEDNANMRRILDRCREVGSVNISSTQLEEEQERELAPEIEQERQIQRPPPAKPEPHHLHPDLHQFVLTGSLKQPSGAFIPAFETLRRTSAASYFDVSQFPSKLLVTGDFAKTIQTSQRSSVLDNYLRPVQWVLTSIIDGPFNMKAVEHVIIISPFEANELFHDIQTSSAVVMHLYSPRQNRTFSALDKLDLYNTPMTNVELPMGLKIQLNLFAGQLYISSYDEYLAICAFLGVAATEAPEGQTIAADGFIVTSKGQSETTFTQSPLKFLRCLMSQFRKEGQKIDKTHVGKILDGKAIYMHEFQDNNGSRTS